MKRLSWQCAVWLLVGWAWAAWGQTLINEGEFLVHETANTPRHNTPIHTTPNGTIYVAFVDPNLDLTVARKPFGGSWTTKILEPNNQSDEFHNIPSLAVDTLGYIWVVGNVHSTPWQIWRSNAPNDITAFTFMGQGAGTVPGKSTLADANCTGQCAVDWLTDEPGIAVIPGNQVTYPTFAVAPNGTIYVAYRECYLCTLSDYHARQWSAGIARLTPHATTPTWTRVGGVRPFAGPDAAKLPIGLSLTVDATNRLHASWIWCNHYTAVDGGNACFTNANSVSYAYSDDEGASWRNAAGTLLTLPLGPTESEVVVGPEWFTTAGATGYFLGLTYVSASRSRQPFITIHPNTANQPLGIHRAYTRYTQGAWTAPILTEFAGSQLFIDPYGVWVQLSSGMRIHRSTNNGSSWAITELDLARGAFTPYIPWDRAYLQQTGHLRVVGHRKNGASSFIVIWTVQYTQPDWCVEP